MNPELEKQPKAPIFDQIIIHYEEGRMIDALVPIDLIDQSDVPVDEEHSQELADNMKNQMGPENPTGQDTPVGIAHITGEDKFRITDGFHRTYGKTVEGEKYILCRIKTNATLEEVIDSRIVSATSHQPTKIPRLVEWINESWELTPWGGDNGISAKSAFALAERNSSGIKLGLDEEQAEEIKQLVREKAKKWDLEVETVLAHLKTAEKIAPELLKSSRKREGKRDLTAITPSHLEILGQIIPGNFEMQRVVCAYVLVNNLSVSNTKKVAKEVAKFEDPEEANEKINEPEWKESLFKAPPKKTRVGPTSNEKLEHRYVLADLEVCRYAIENTVLRGRYVAIPLTSKKPMPIIYSPEDVPEPAKPFPWSGQNRKDLEGWIALVEGQGMAIAEEHSGSLNEQTAKDIVEATRNRIIDDMKGGALLYSGVESKQLLAKLYMVCLNEQIQHRIKKSSQQSTDTNQTETTKDLDQVRLDKSSFRTAVVGIENLQQRRVLELTAMFRLPAFAIGQILDIPKTDVKSLQTKSAKELSSLKSS